MNINNGISKLPETREELLELLKDKEFTDKAMTVLKKEGVPGKRITLTEFVEAVGAEEVADLLFNNSSVKAVGFNKETYESIVEKHKRGEELTEEEEVILKTVEEVVDDSDDFDSEDNECILYSTIAIVASSGNSYDTNGAIIAMLLNIFSFIAATGGERLSKLGLSDTTVIQQIGDKIGEDILKSWENTLDKDHGITEDMVLLGLVHAIGNRFCVASSPLADKKFDLKNYIPSFHLDEILSKKFDSDCNCEECQCHCKSENKEEDIRSNLRDQL